MLGFEVDSPKTWGEGEGVEVTASAVGCGESRGVGEDLGVGDGLGVGVGFGVDVDVGVGVGVEMGVGAEVGVGVGKAISKFITNELDSPDGPDLLFPENLCNFSS